MYIVFHLFIVFSCIYIYIYFYHITYYIFVSFIFLSLIFQSTSISRKKLFKFAVNLIAFWNGNFHFFLSPCYWVQFKSIICLNVASSWSWYVAPSSLVLTSYQSFLSVQNLTIIYKYHSSANFLSAVWGAMCRLVVVFFFLDNNPSQLLIWKSAPLLRKW